MWGDPTYESNYKLSYLLHLQPYARSRKKLKKNFKKAVFAGLGDKA